MQWNQSAPQVRLVLSLLDVRLSLCPWTPPPSSLPIQKHDLRAAHALLFSENSIFSPKILFQPKCFLPFLAFLDVLHISGDFEYFSANIFSTPLKNNVAVPSYHNVQIFSQLVLHLAVGEARQDMMLAGIPVFRKMECWNNFCAGIFLVEVVGGVVSLRYSSLSHSTSPSKNKYA